MKATLRHILNLKKEYNHLPFFDFLRDETLPDRQRLAIIEAIEETGNVLFELIGKLAVQIEQETGIELRYCGEFHFSKESGHAMNCDHAIMAQIEMDEETRAEAIEKVNLVFVWFREWTEELLAYAKQSSNYTDEALIANFPRSMTSV
jgi:hypothetical protein